MHRPASSVMTPLSPLLHSHSYHHLQQCWINIIVGIVNILVRTLSIWMMFVSPTQTYRSLTFLWDTLWSPCWTQLSNHFLALLYVLLITSTDCTQLIMFGLIRHFWWTQYLVSQDISTGCLDIQCLGFIVTTLFLVTLNTSWEELPIFRAFVCSQLSQYARCSSVKQSRVQTISLTGNI